MEHSKTKGIAALLVGKMGKGPEGEEGGDMEGEGLDTAAEDILAAIESKDPQALKEALRSFYEMC